MIIDRILDRKDGEKYNPIKFYYDCMRYSSVFDGIGDGITRAMDSGSENDVKHELCIYLIENDYNLDICGYVHSVNWIKGD